MIKYLVLFLLLSQSAYAGGVIFQAGGVAAAAGGACDTVVFDLDNTTDTGADIKDSAAKTLIGNIYTATATDTICEVTFDLYGKDGVGPAYEDYHVEIWTIFANGVGGCTAADGCLNTQIGPDSSEVTGDGTWTTTTKVLFEDMNSDIVSGTTYFIGVTHSGVASGTNEIQTRYENGGTGTRAQVGGDTSGAEIIDAAGGNNFALYSE